MFFLTISAFWSHLTVVSLHAVCPVAEIHWFLIFNARSPMKAKFGQNATHQITCKKTCWNDYLLFFVERWLGENEVEWTPVQCPWAGLLPLEWRFYNHAIYTAVTQYSFLRTHKDGLQPDHLHHCQTVQLYMYTQWWFTTRPFTPLLNSAVLHVCT